MSVRERFPVGCRVRLNAKGKGVRPKGSDTGSVVGYGLAGMNDECLRVLWDGYSAPQTWHANMVERVDPDFDPVALGM